MPLEKGGPCPTCHMVDKNFLKGISHGAILINTSRGPVADTRALEQVIVTGGLSAAVLDVWEGEPGVPLGLLSQAAIGTPHIAGYSFDGKVRGTKMIYESASRFFGIQPDWDPTELLPAPVN